MTLLGISFRSHRTGIVAIALLGAVFGFVNAVAYVQVAGTTPAERAAFARQVALLGAQLSYLLPEPLQLDTLGGYLTWRAFGSFGIICAIWGVVAGSGVGRGDEERGLVEHWLASGVSRARLLATRALGYAVSAAAALGCAMAATELGTIFAGEPVPAVALAQEGVALAGLTLLGFGLGVAVAQVCTTRRAAGTLGSLALVLLFLLNSAGRSGVAVGGLRELSPFFAFDRSRPLLAGGSLDVAATGALAGAALLLLAASALAFVRRDIGAPVLRIGGERTRFGASPSADPLLRLPVLALVGQQRWWICGWAIALAILGYFLTSITRGIVDSLLTAEIPGMRAYFERASIGGYSDFVGVIWLGTALLLVSIFVVMHVSVWAADDAEGRLETVLAAGASRGRVVLERLGALLIAAFVVVTVSNVAVYVSARAYGITVPADRFALATILMLPVVYALGAVGHALVGWRPRVAVVVTAGISAVSFLTQEFAPLFGWPDLVRDTSLYTLYGTPLTRDEWSGGAALVGIGLAGTVAALASMGRRDVST